MACADICHEDRLKEARNLNSPVLRPPEQFGAVMGVQKKKDGTSPVGSGGLEGHAGNLSKQWLSFASCSKCKAGWEIYFCQGFCKRPWNMFQFQLPNQTHLMQ